MIHVIDDYVIDCDGSQYIMGKIGTSISKKDGSEVKYIKNPSYYGTITSALLGVSRRRRAEAVKDTNGDLNDLYEAIRACDTQMLKAIGKFDNLKVVELDADKE